MGRHDSENLLVDIAYLFRTSFVVCMSTDIEVIEVQSNHRVLRRSRAGHTWFLYKSAPASVHLILILLIGVLGALG